MGLRYDQLKKAIDYMREAEGQYRDEYIVFCDGDVKGQKMSAHVVIYTDPVKCNVMKELVGIILRRLNSSGELSCDPAAKYGPEMESTETQKRETQANKQVTNRTHS